MGLLPIAFHHNLQFLRAQLSLSLQMESVRSVLNLPLLTGAKSLSLSSGVVGVMMAHFWVMGPLQKLNAQTFLVVQWLRLYEFPTEGAGLICGWGTKISHATWCSKKSKKKKAEGWGWSAASVLPGLPLPWWNHYLMDLGKWDHGSRTLSSTGPR